MNLCDSCNKTNICPWSCNDNCTECNDYKKMTHEEHIKFCAAEQKANKRFMEWVKEERNGRMSKM